MKESYTWLAALALLTWWSAPLTAQTPEGLAKGTLQDQFEYMVEESSRYQNYKLVPQTWLSTFWEHARDTLREQQRRLQANALTVQSQRDSIDRFETGKMELEARIETLDREKNSLKFLGITLDKAVYHVLVWAIIAGLVAGLLFFLGRFRYANAITRKTRNDNQELEEKVAQLRRRMLEKEQELRRQLQDEINKRLR